MFKAIPIETANIGKQAKYLTEKMKYYLKFE